MFLPDCCHRTNSRSCSGRAWRVKADAKRVGVRRGAGCANSKNGLTRRVCPLSGTDECKQSSSSHVCGRQARKCRSPAVRLLLVGDGHRPRGRSHQRPATLTYAFASRLVGPNLGLPKRKKGPLRWRNDPLRSAEIGDQPLSLRHLRPLTLILPAEPSCAARHNREVIPGNYIFL